MKTYIGKIDDYGTKRWYLNDKLHREDGPAVEHADGSKLWYLNGKLHREDGPAVEHIDGFKSWWLNGKLHREDGPAVENADGFKWWWLNGKEYSTKQQWRSELDKRNKTCNGKVVEVDGVRYKLVAM